MFDGYRLPEGTVVADIGGADGSMMVRLLADDPGRRGIVFDQPEVVAAAEKNLVDHNLADRVQAVAGDFFQSVPAADVYIVSYILHDWNDEDCRRILRNIASAANPGARLVIIEAILPPGDEPHPAKVIDLTMLAMNNGRERTAAEYTALLDSAGFTSTASFPARQCSPSPKPRSADHEIAKVPAAHSGGNIHDLSAAEWHTGSEIAPHRVNAIHSDMAGDSPKWRGVKNFPHASPIGRLVRMDEVARATRLPVRE